MKKKMKKTNIRTLVALLIASATFAACSSEDNEIQNEQPADLSAKVYTMTIPASKGDGNAATRGLYIDDSQTRKPLMVDWNGTEKVRVVQNGNVIGTLTATASSSANTTLSGTVTGVDMTNGIKFILLADEKGKMDYTGQVGALLTENGTGNIEENYDFASYELNATELKEAFKTEGSNLVAKDGTKIAFESQQAIVRFELKKSDGSTLLYASKFFVTDKNTGKLVQSIDAKSGTKTYGHVTLTPSGLSTSYVYNVALNLDGNTSDIRLFAEAKDQYGNPELYSFEKENVTFTKGKYYRVTVKMSRITNFPLSEITHEDTQFTGWYIGSGDNKSAYQLGGSVNAVIAYVGKVPGYFDNFLAMAMHDSKKDGSEGSQVMTWSEALTATGSYATAHPIVIGTTTYNTSSHGSSAYDRVEYHVKTKDTDPEPDTYPTNTATGAARQGWRLPTVTDWRYVFEGLCGSPSATDPVGIKQNRGPYADNNATLYSTLNSKAENMVESGYYWTGSEDNTLAWYFSFNQGSSAVKGFFYSDKGNNCYVRPVFAY